MKESWLKLEIENHDSSPTPECLLLTTAQAAKALAITPSRVRQLILENRLPAMKVGRDQLIRQDDLDVFSKLPRLRTGRRVQI
jgi:excisionase family DNA binding protein